MIGAVPGQLDALAPDLEGAAVLEGFFWCGPCGVVVTQQKLSRLLVPDASDVPVKQRGCPGVIGVVMRVDQVGHLVAYAIGHGNLIHGTLDVVTDGGRRVE